MNKDKLLEYWDAVHELTMSLKNPDNNKFGKKCIRYEHFQIGFDELAIYETEEEIIVVVNGSDGDEYEWKSNFNAYPIIYDTHNGFYNRGRLYITTLQEKIDEFVKKSGGKPVVFVGHSRGGPLVQVMCEFYGDDSECVTYGSPRLFTRKGAKKRVFKHTRVYSIFDPVVHIPMIWLPPGFKHYQTEKIKIKHRIHGEFSHTHYGDLIKKYL